MSPEKTISGPEILSQDELTSEEMEKLSHRLTGRDFSKNYLINALGAMPRMFLGDRKEECRIFSVMLSKMFQSGIAQPTQISHIIYTRGDSISVGDPWSLDKNSECRNVPYYLQHTMKMFNAVVFNIEQECTGSFTALGISKMLIESGRGENILILSSNYFEPTHKRLMGGSIFIGDGQGLCLISKDLGFMEIVDESGRADGSINTVNSFLDTESQKRVIEIGVDVIKNLLERNSLSIDDISTIVPLNTSLFSWRSYSKLLNITLKKVFLENFGLGGHLGDVDLIRNLESLSLRQTNRFEYFLAYGVSTGTSWSAILLQSHPDPSTEKNSARDPQ